MVLQAALEAWRVGRIFMCRMKRRARQGGGISPSLEARAGLVCMSTVSKEAGRKDLHERSLGDIVPSVLQGQYRPHP